MGRADRMARIARIRALQKRLALAEEAQALKDRDQLRQMANRIEALQQVYKPTSDHDEGFALKAVVHQYERLGKALLNTRNREARAETALGVARVATLDAHMRKRAADELSARAEAAEEKAAEQRRERNAVPRRNGR